MDKNDIHQFVRMIASRWMSGKMALKGNTKWTLISHHIHKV